MIVYCVMMKREGKDRELGLVFSTEAEAKLDIEDRQCGDKHCHTPTEYSVEEREIDPPSILDIFN